MRIVFIILILTFDWIWGFWVTFACIPRRQRWGIRDWRGWTVGRNAVHRIGVRSVWEALLITLAKTRQRELVMRRQTVWVTETLRPGRTILLNGTGLGMKNNEKIIQSVRLRSLGILRKVQQCVTLSSRSSSLSSSSSNLRFHSYSTWTLGLNFPAAACTSWNTHAHKYESLYAHRNWFSESVFAFIRDLNR